VLLKRADHRGFAFFTNYESRKGREIAINPRVALAIHWAQLERQVCIQGLASPLSREESEAYFRIRPLASRLAAWASRQSEVVSGREELEKAMAEVKLRFPGEEVPLPPRWGGFLVRPETIEFWQGRPSRLHDRLCFFRLADGSWDLGRLSP
jgi:pyridoxamine 5'-phosphate oxidase